MQLPGTNLPQLSVTQHPGSICCKILNTLSLRPQNSVLQQFCRTLPDPQLSTGLAAHICVHRDSSRFISDQNQVSVEFRGVTSTVWAPLELRENGKPSWLTPAQAPREATPNMTQGRFLELPSLHICCSKEHFPWIAQLAGQRSAPFALPASEGKKKPKPNDEISDQRWFPRCKINEKWLSSYFHFCSIKERDSDQTEYLNCRSKLTWAW